MSIQVHSTEQLSEIAEKLADCAGKAESPRADSSPCGPPIQQHSVIELVNQLRGIIFPEIAKGNTPESRGVVEAELADVSKRLVDLINQISESSSEQPDQGIVPIDVTMEFLSKLPAIRTALWTDVRAAYDGDPACKSTDEVILCYPGLLAVTVYRLAHELYLAGVPLIPRMMSEWVHGQTGIDIHPGARIGNHFFVDHGTGVVIGETCVIGEYVKVYQGVTLGALSFPHNESGELIRTIKRHPTIEDRVVIYANATVLGGKTVVGHDCVIGSSVWLTDSVAPFTTVIMEKPKLRLRNQTPNEFETPLDFQI